MSMECDTRLSMMALREKTRRNVRPERTRAPKTAVRRYSATAATAMATFALTLFTRGV